MSRIAPRVLVLGLKPNQAQTLQEEFAADLDLSCHKPDCHRGKATTIRKAQTADHVVILASFVAPKDLQQLKRSAPALHIVRGGVSSVRKELKQLCPNG